MNDRVEALRIRWDRKEDVEEAELARLRDDPDPAIRVLAARMTFEAAARPALEAIARAFGAEGQWNDDTQWVAASAQLARADEPVPYMLKAAGIAAVRRGDLDDAITFLTHAMAWAMRLGQSGDPRSRRLMRYALDPDFDAAYEAIAARMSLPRYYNPPEGKQRVAVLIPFDREGNSVGLAAAGFAAALCKRGFDAFVVSTRMVDSAPETEQRRWLHVAGSRFIEAGGQTTLERIAWLLDFFERDPVHAAVYMSDPQDPLPRLCEIIGLANVQLFINMAYEHRTGRLDALVQTVEPQQVERSLRPDVAVFVPSAVARDREIVAAMPASRAELGIPADAVILATFGRLSKLAQRGFLEAVTTILRDEPSAIWMIAGAGVKAELDAITGAIDGAGVRERVVILGERGAEIPALLKMSDVYLDPFPFPGAMSTGEAMFAALPVVAMRRARDVDLDPTQTGPTTAAGEAIIGDAAPMVAPNDIAAYVSLARRYVTDVAERKRVGRALRERADRELTWNGMMDRYRDVILEAISQRAPAGEDELSAVVVVPSPLALERVVARIENDDGRYAAKRIAIVINGPDADLDVRAQRYGERVQIIRLAQHVESLDAARAGIAAAGTPLCAVLDGSALPVRNWAAEGVAGARRRGYGLISGGVVVATARSEDVEEGLAALSASRTTTATQRDRPVPSERILALQDRYAAHDEFSSTEIDELCASSDGRLRALGERITFEKLVEPAFDAALRLAELDDSLTHNLIAFLSGAVKARHPQAYMAAMKLRARRALSEGDLETALHAAGDGIRAAMGAAQLGIKRWHRLLHAASDPEWDALFDAAAAKLSAPRTYPAASAARSRFAIVVSVDYPVNSLSLVASRLAIGLRELGHDVCYTSTEYYPSMPDSPTAISVQAAGGEVIRAQGTTLVARTNDLLERFARNPADAALYLVDQADPIARVLEIVGLANAQALVTAGFDQGSGRVDAFVHTVDPQQIARAIHPERSVFIKTGIARDREILAARAALRTDVDLRPDDIVLMTSGRLNKSLQRDFLRAVLTALQRNKRLRWLLLGPRDEQALATLDRAIGAAGVGGQIQWPGAVHDRLPSYLLTADIYCDTFPFPGGQSLGEAMFAGLPIVATRRAIDADLDPTGAGPTSATADVLIGDAVELVPSGDVAAYTERILAYAADPDMRKRDGARLRERAIAELKWERVVRDFDAVLTRIADRRVTAAP